MSDLAYRTASELLVLLRDKEVGALELCDFHIDRIERLDSRVNAVVVRDFDRARERAKAMDNSAAESQGPLSGLPITIKESYNVQGLPTTWGFAEAKGNIATESAEVVQRYQQAGAVLLGKTNVPYGLEDFQSYNDLYGTTNNPWDLERTPGGSSGGSAAAIAAGFSALEAGSDIGGSIRNPAHFCGVYGHKPTWGVVPPQGHGMPGTVAGSDIAVCGPLARSAEDLALAMDVIAGVEPLNRAGWQLNLPRPDKQRLSDYRVAVWATDSHCPVDQETQQAINSVAEALSKAGATVSFDARPDIDVPAASQTFTLLMHSIMGASAGDEAFQKSKELAAQLGPDDMSTKALMARARSCEHRDWLRANNRREKLRYQWREFFDQWDILLCPQMASAAFKHDHGRMSERTIDVDGQPQPYFKQIFWSGLITAAYLPSTIFPAARTVASPKAGLPIGLQAVSAEYFDYQCIDFCRLLAQELGGFSPPAELEQ